jgi:hypothetical protein
MAMLTCQELRMLKKLLLLWLLSNALVLAQDCDVKECNRPRGELLKDVPFQAARFPLADYSEEDLKSISYGGTGEEISALWLPTEADLEALENALQTQLAAPDDERYPEVLEFYNDYRRQYIGVVINNQKLIMANFDRCSSFETGQLEADFISVLPLDGGTCFLELVFDPKSKTLPRFYLHGEA